MSYLRTKVSLTLIADTEHRQAGGDRFYRMAVSNLHRQIVLGNEHAPARVDVEGARVDILGLDVLDRFWLAGGLIDGEHDDAVFAAFKDLFHP